MQTAWRQRVIAAFGFIKNTRAAILNENNAWTINKWYWAKRKWECKGSLIAGWATLCWNQRTTEIAAWSLR